MTEMYGVRPDGVLWYVENGTMKFDYPPAMAMAIPVERDTSHYEDHRPCGFPVTPEREIEREAEQAQWEAQRKAQLEAERKAERKAKRETVAEEARANGTLCSGYGNPLGAGEKCRIVRGKGMYCRQCFGRVPACQNARTHKHRGCMQKASALWSTKCMACVRTGR